MPETHTPASLPARSDRFGGSWLRLLVLVAAAVYTGHLIDAILADRALFADGANFFAQLIATPARWPIADDATHIRLFVNALNQWPVAAARALGVQQLPVLRMLFGAGLLLQPLLLYLYSLSLSRRAGDHRVFACAAASLVACAMPSEVFAVNQAFTAMALTWIVLHYVLLDLRLTVRDHAVMAVTSVLLFRAHEGMVMWGVIIAVAALARLLALRPPRLGRHSAHHLALGVTGIAQSAYVLYWQATHPVAEQTDAFLQLVDLALPAAMWTGNARIALLTAACALTVLGSAVLARVRGPGPVAGPGRAMSMLLVAAVVVMLASAGAALADPTALDPMREFNYRFLIPFGGAACMTTAVGVLAADVRLDEVRARLLVVALAGGLLASSSWQSGTTMHWRVFRAASRETLHSASGPLVSPQEVERALVRAGAPEVWRFQWPWAWTVFGLSLQDDPVVTALFLPGAEHHRFVMPRAPAEPVEVPFVTFQAGGILRFDQWAARLPGETPPAPPGSPAP